MKKLITIIFILLPFLSACTKSLQIKVSNSLPTDRIDEIIELNLTPICQNLNITESDSFIIENDKREEIPYQITYDKKIIFQASVHALGNTKFYIHKGNPQTYVTRTCGKVYTERLDDLAWENDLVGFRTYGPALQKRGERAFGYDLFAKRGTNEPVLADMYAKATDPKKLKELKALRKKDPEAAKKMQKTITYHADHGHGMDCYSVGPTLGAGTTALLNGNEIIYPWCYKKCEILDNGPLRFTARLTYPIKYKESEITEIRIITLDAGSHMNYTTISYQGLKGITPMVTGIVIHNGSDIYSKNTEEGYITYQDPTSGPNQGNLFIGHIFPNSIKDVKAVYFSKEEKKIRNNANGHILVENLYTPNTEFGYYWGFGWNRSDIKDFEYWNTYVKQFSQRIKSPLNITYN